MIHCFKQFLYINFLLHSNLQVNNQLTFLKSHKSIINSLRYTTNILNILPWIFQAADRSNVPHFYLLPLLWKSNSCQHVSASPHANGCVVCASAAREDVWCSTRISNQTMDLLLQALGTVVYPQKTFISLLGLILHPRRYAQEANEYRRGAAITAHTCHLYINLHVLVSNSSCAAIDLNKVSPLCVCMCVLATYWRIWRIKCGFKVEIIFGFRSGLGLGCCYG